MGVYHKVSFIVICVILALPLLIIGVMVAMDSDSTTTHERRSVTAGCFLTVAVLVLGVVGAVIDSRGLVIAFIILIFFGVAYFIVAGSLTVAEGLSEDTLKDVIKKSDDQMLGRIIKARLPKAHEECCGCQYKPYSTAPPQCKEGESAKPDCCIELEKAMKKDAMLAGGVIFGLVFLEIAAIVVAWMICSEIREKEQKVMLAPLGKGPPMPGMHPSPGVPSMPGMPPPPAGMPPGTGTPLTPIQGSKPVG